MYGNSIYKIGKDGLSLSYSFDFGNKAFDINILKKQSNSEGYLKNKDFYSIHSVQETNKILSFSLSEPSSPFLHQGYYSKETKNLLYSYFYTIGKEGQFQTPTIAAYDSWLISELSIDNLLSWKKETQNNIFENKFLQEKKRL